MQTGSFQPHDKSRLERNLTEELAGARLYHALSEAETDPKIAQIYAKLARVEESHAEFWRKKLTASGATVQPHGMDLRTRVLIWLARRFGPSFVLQSVLAGEVRDSRKYEGNADAGSLALQEQGHARVLASILKTAGDIDGAQIRKLEGRHRGSGNSFRAAILGANDGLLSNFSLVMGVAGGTSAHGTLILTGFAGLVAGAFSMGLGEWISVSNTREFYQSQISIESEELEANPEEEREELSLIYQSKGIPEAEAERLADGLIGHRDSALDTLAREELGIDPQELGGSASGAAIASFAFFSVGAAVPILPLLATSTASALWFSILASACVMLLLGAVSSFLTGLSPVRGAARQLVVGSVAAGFTYGIGHLLGGTLGG